MRLRILAPLSAKPELDHLLDAQGAAVEYQDLGLSGQQARAPDACLPCPDPNRAGRQRARTPCMQPRACGAATPALVWANEVRAPRGSVVRAHLVAAAAVGVTHGTRCAHAMPRSPCLVTSAQCGVRKWRARLTARERARAADDAVPGGAGLLPHAARVRAVAAGRAPGGRRARRDRRRLRAGRVRRAACGRAAAAGRRGGRRGGGAGGAQARPMPIP